MPRPIFQVCPARNVTLIIMAAVIFAGGICGAEENPTINKYDLVRAYIQTWLMEAGKGSPIISCLRLKQNIVDDWQNQSEKYQIISVRKPEDFKDAGHIRNAINIYWVDILADESLKKIDADKTQILYCYYGHGSILCSTILSLMGYDCYSLEFGMMDWNLDALVKEPWDMTADYEIETTVNLPQKLYPVVIIESNQTDPRTVIKEMALKYFGGEGSPIMRSADLKEILDDWSHNKNEYQVVDVRPKRNYETGHIPHAINILWTEIANIENLTKLDPQKTAIVCSDNGQEGQLAATILNLLGYKSINLLFGMADWNKEYADINHRRDGIADYPIDK